MIIKTLVENTSISDDFRNEHGLSLFIATKKHKILFDLGASELFAENAEKLGVDLAAVDIVVISHGHYDHGGGLKTFLKLNSRAKIYLNQKAFEKHYSNQANSDKKYIGLDEELLTNSQLVFVNDHLVIDEELELFSDVQGKKLTSKGNLDLLKQANEKLTPDDFSHEQNLLIHENQKTALFAGCAHNGIVNIIDRVIDMRNNFPAFVIGGFHLYNPAKNVSEDDELIKRVAGCLENTTSKYYTCHCTGIEPFRKLKEILGDQIEYLATGRVLEL